MIKKFLLKDVRSGKYLRGWYDYNTRKDMPNFGKDGGEAMQFGTYAEAEEAARETLKNAKYKFEYAFAVEGVLVNE